MSREALAWAAGLFEGEGAVVAYANRPGAPKKYVRLMLPNTDEGLVRKFAETVGVGTVFGPYGPYAGQLGKKPQWRWQTNTFEYTQAVVAMLWHWLSPRRREQVLSKLAERG